jgi:hypothetical protein
MEKTYAAAERGYRPYRCRSAAMAREHLYSHGWEDQTNPEYCGCYRRSDLAAASLWGAGFTGEHPHRLDFKFPPDLGTISAHEQSLH